MDASDWDSRYEEKELIWSAGPNQFVEEFCSGLRPGRAIDLAAGEGRNALWLAEQGWEVDAVDFSAVAVSKLAKISAKRGVDVSGIVADLAEFVPEPGAYDLVLVIYLHVLADLWATIMDRAAAALAPGGRLLVVGHDRSNLGKGIGGPQNAAVLTTPSVTADALAPLIKIDRAEVVDRIVQTDDGPVTAKDTLVSAHRPLTDS